MEVSTAWLYLCGHFLQEVKGLERQKEEAKDDKQKKNIKGKLSLKTLERDLADAKKVREIPGIIKVNIIPTNIHDYASTNIAMSL